MSITGTWTNEFGSIMKIPSVNPDGTFGGSYASHTGATGVYILTGLVDPDPDPSVNSQAVAFSVSWRSLEGPPDPSWHWVSAFAGQLQTIDGAEVITTTMLLQKNTDPSDNWTSTTVTPVIFKRQEGGE